VCGALSCSSWSIGRTENSQAADGDPLAPRWFPSLLALEIPTAPWPAKDTGGHSPAHSRHERREPALGSTADPRRTAQAWHRCRADHRGKIHGEEKATTVAGLEDLSAQSRRRRCVDGFVRSPDDLVSAVVWISDLTAFPARASVAERDRASERPLDCPSADRSVRLATGAAIYRSRSGLRLWRCRHPAASSSGYPGSTDFAAVAMAKRVCGETHRFDPTGLLRCCVRRTASTPSAQFLSKILQRGSDAPVAAQGRAGPACRPDCRSPAGDAGPGRTPPPIFQSVRFRHGQRSQTSGEAMSLGRVAEGDELESNILHLRQ